MLEARNAAITSRWTTGLSPVSDSAGPDDRLSVSCPVVAVDFPPVPTVAVL